ncbi:MAG: hypothetical protein IKA36_06590 [Clostridia bacterium]|nr:hypothetical protein [Clostridia bacterium]
MLKFSKRGFMGLIDFLIDLFSSDNNQNNSQDEIKMKLIKEYYDAYIRNFYAQHKAIFSAYEEDYRDENGYFSSLTGINDAYQYNEQEYPVPPVPDGAIDLSLVEFQIEKTKTFMAIKDYQEDVFFENFYYYVKNNCKVSSQSLSKLFELVTYERKWNKKNYDDWKKDDTLF